jgi:predicted DNA-binding transcriptional regulator YafY
MQHTVDAQKMVALLNEHPDGLTKDQIKRKCGVRSDRTFYAILALARVKSTIPTPVNKIYKIESAQNIENQSDTLLADDEELITLLTIKHILSSMTAGQLQEFLTPLKPHFDTLIGKLVKDPTSWAKRIRILDIHYRTIEPGVFSFLTRAIARKRAVTFDYTDSSGQNSHRVISPQQLVRYKDNWYLDGWCHESLQLRIFSLDTIKNYHFKNTPYKEIGEEELQRTYATSYGLFSGEPKATAVLLFSGKAARYATREHWHSQQVLTIRNDSKVQLQIPFNNPAELIRTILYWGDEVEVIAPEKLRNEIATIAKRVVQQYGFAENTQ